MARKCSVCTHADLAAIDAAIVEGKAIRRIAADYGVSESALRRHSEGHLPETLVEATRAIEVTRGDNLIDRLLYLSNETMSILADARQSRDHATALSAIARAESQILLQGKLLGQMADVSVTTNVLVTNSEWLSLRGAILDALLPYPDARQAVLDAIS